MAAEVCLAQPCTSNHCCILLHASRFTQHINHDRKPHENMVRYCKWRKMQWLTLHFTPCHCHPQRNKQLHEDASCPHVHSKWFQLWLQRKKKRVLKSSVAAMLQCQSSKPHFQDRCRTKNLQRLGNLTVSWSGVTFRNRRNRWILYVARCSYPQVWRCKRHKAKYMQ